MPRRKSVGLERKIGVDSKFNSYLAQKLINMVMEHGKKSVARAIVYEAFDVLSQRSGGDSKNGLQLFERAVEKIRPAVEVKSRRVGGGVYQIPAEVGSRRSLALALRWLIKHSIARPDKTMGKRLASEILDALEGRGGAYKKRCDVHRMAEANRAFSHYAW